MLSCLCSRVSLPTSFPAKANWGQAPLPRLPGEAVALLQLKSPIPTWLLLVFFFFLSWPLVWHVFILLPTWTDWFCWKISLCCAKIGRDAMCCCTKVSAGIAWECHKSLIQAIISQTLSADNSQQGCQKSAFFSPLHLQLPCLCVLCSIPSPVSWECFCACAVDSNWEADPCEN